MSNVYGRIIGSILHTAINNYLYSLPISMILHIFYLLPTIKDIQVGNRPMFTIAYLEATIKDIH